MEERTVVERVFLTGFLVIVIIIGLIGNTLVIVATIKFHALRRTVSNFLLLNLAISDLLCSVLVMPYHLAAVIRIDIISNDGVLCVVGGAVAYPMFLVSTLTLVMLATDRYIAVSDPLRYKARVTCRTILLMVSYTWLHAMLFTTLTLSLVKIEFDHVSLDCGVSWDKNPLWFGVLSVLLNIAVPFVFLVFTSLKVLGIARKHHKTIKAELATVHQSNIGRHVRGREYRATSAILLVILLFLVTWLPYLVTRALRVFGIILPSVVYTASVWALHTNAAFNVFIYARRNQNYRRAFMAILRQRTSLDGPEIHTSN